MSNKLPIITVLGSTCTGKTELAIELQEKLPIEIISVDSAMIYKDMNIGTDKPSKETLDNIRHHLINIRTPDEDYNVADFYHNVKGIIKDIHSRNKIPLLVGGSLMYFHSLYNGLSDLPSKNIEDRNIIDKLLDKYSLKQLHQCLKAIDEISYNRIESNDKQRIQRALEVYMSSGKSISKLFENRASFLNSYNVMTIKMYSSDRKIIHNKISLRIDKMFERGLIEEVKYIINKYNLSSNSKSMKIIGYRHVFEYLSHNDNKIELKNKCLYATRQLAKRQITWLKQFQSDLDVDILELDYKNVYELTKRHCNLSK